MSELERRRRLYRAVRLIPSAVSIPVAREGLPGSSEDSVSSPEAEQTGGEGEKSLSPEELRIASLEEDKKSLEKKVASLTSQVESSRGRVEDMEEMSRKREEEFRRQEKTLRKELEQRLEKERDTARENGLEEGRRQGYAEGKEQAVQEARQLYAERFDKQVALLEQIYASMDKDLARLLEGNQHRLVRMWEAVLRSLLQREITLNEATAMEVLRSVLQRLTDRDSIVVYLHPSDFDVITSRKDEFADILRGIQHVEFLKDDHVDEGSCLVETSMGIYDARWRTQLEQIAEEVNGVLEKDEDHDSAE